MKLFGLLVLLALVSCSSKPKNSADSAVGDGDLSKDGLVLHGSSDLGNAGGLRTVYFTMDSSILSETSKADLRSNAEFLKAHKNVAIEVEGHCDERGGRQYNLSLGERRAKATKDYLRALGVPKEQVTTISYGNERPVEEGHSENSWSKNRRANFSITAK